MDKKGVLRYKVSGLEYSFGTLVEFSETFNKSANTVPIVTLSYKDAFAVESSSALVYSFKFVRVQPISPDDNNKDMTLWSNKHWFTEMTKLVDRWQALTDGGIIEYTPSDDNPYLPGFKHNGYIKSISKAYYEGRNTEIECSLEFHVGTMYINTARSADDPYLPSTIKPCTKNDFLVLISDAEQSAWYTLLSTSEVDGKTVEVNCISNYRIYGGMEEPFEHMTLTIPKERLAAIAPELIDPTKIVAGKNKIIVDAVGRSSMYVSKSSLRGDNYIIDAYCDATVLRDKELLIDYADTPFNWIRNILGSGKYGVAFHEGKAGQEPEGTFIYSCFDMTSDEHILSFGQGSKVWDVLQICATYMGCKLFFSNGNAYLIDFRLHEDESKRIRSVNPAPSALIPDSSLDLYTTNVDDPVYSRVTGNVELGNEGIDTLINIQPIRCTSFDEKGNLIRKEISGKNQPSIDTFGEMTGDVIDIPNLIQGQDGDVLKNQADIFAASFLDYRAEPQQSITFTLKEMQKRRDENDNVIIEWAPFFDPSVSLGSISSSVNKIEISNMSSIESMKGIHVPQKLILSSYVRDYPDGTSKYCFGQIASVDLSSSTSQIVGNLNRG